MAITGIDTIDGKQIIAAGASSAVKAAQDGNGNNIAITYQTTAGMSNYQTTADMGDYATTADLTGKQDALTFNYNESDLITGINSSGIATDGGSFPASADEACQVVTANSADWNEVSAKLAVSSTDNSNIQYNDNKLYVKAASSYGIDVLGTGHMNGTIVYDEPFSLTIPHYFSSNFGGSGPTYGFSAFDENDVLLYTASSNSIGYRYKLTNYNMTYVGPNTGTARNSPIKYFSLSSNITDFDHYVISAYKNISATGYSSSDEFALAKNVIRSDGKSGYDVYFKDDTLYFESPYNTNIAINYASVSFLNSMYQAISHINPNTMGLGYSSDGYKFYVNAEDYSGSRRIELKNIIRAETTGLYTNNMSANNYGFTANGISAGDNRYFCIKSNTESFSGGGASGFTFTSVNTGFGTAQLTTAGSNQIVQMYSPKFEVRNISGAGFSIEASGAKGYDHNGNVTWDTTVVPAPDRLISFAATQPAILISPTPSSQSGYAPYLSANYQELAIKYNNGPSAIMNLNGFSIKNGNNQVSIGAQGIAVTGSDVNLYVPEISASYSLRNSIQKTDIDGDSATSAISAIAGSALTCELPVDLVYTATLSATSGLLNDDIQTVSAAIPVLSSLNTEGITDIQLVNELPVDPVSTVLYLIPEA